MAGTSWQPLTARENAVLAAVERRLGNAEIADEFLISIRTVESHIASLRRKLGVDSRASLITAARQRRGAAIQVPQNSFVGREDDLETVGALLDRERWVTVVGAAGCGKTRLALELAAVDARIPVVAELEHAKPGDVSRVFARAIGLDTNTATDLVAACGMAFGVQPYLLVIDNCDRVTDAVGEVVGQLLPMAQSLTVLATSRSPIGGPGETVYPLSPLSVDAGEDAAAVRMFLDRARSAAPTAHLDADTALVSAICRRLDGLPLAIELAAARARHLPLAELATRLEAGFGTLDRAGPASRHRTLETAFDWTWDLLDDDERATLSQLAALPRTFDLELADAVTAPGSSGVVVRLLDRSLVSPTATVSDPQRFRLLTSLRAFVLDRTDPAVVLHVRHAHAAHIGALATRLTDRARTDDSRVAVDEANRLCPELNAALRWTIIRRDALGLPLTRALAIGCEQYGANIDSLELIALAARDPRIRSLTTTSDLLFIGIALCYGDLELVAELASLALDIATDDRSELAARHLAGYADAYRQRGKSALAHFDQAERLADELRDTWQLASVQQGKGIALKGQDLNDPEAAIAAFESSMRTYAIARDTMHVNNARYMMAATAADSGLRTQEAVVWTEQCAAYARDSGNRHELAHAMLTRAALSSTPDVDLTDTVEAFRSVGDLRCLTRSYFLLARDRPARQQVPLLEHALEVTRAVHDVTNEITALERLIRAHWDAGNQRAAAIALGELTNLVGDEPAAGRSPDEMVSNLDQWATAITEGRAYGVRDKA